MLIRIYMFQRMIKEISTIYVFQNFSNLFVLNLFCLLKNVAKCGNATKVWYNVLKGLSNTFFVLKIICYSMPVNVFCKET